MAASLAVLLLLDAPAVLGQARHAGEYAWRPIFEHEGVAFSYIFYPQDEAENDGLVLRLVNANEYAVRYRFTVVLRSASGAEFADEVKGRLAPGQMKTGSADGLFWTPFPPGESIAEVGLRGYEIVTLE